MHKLYLLLFATLPAACTNNSSDPITKTDSFVQDGKVLRDTASKVVDTVSNGFKSAMMITVKLLHSYLNCQPSI